MTELEQVLYESLARVSVPGDPSGVAGAIQARVDAVGTGGGHGHNQTTDDVGEPRDYLSEPNAKSSGNGSGFGGVGGAGIAPWLPWIGVLLVAAIVGGVTGASGLVGSPAPVLSSVRISLTGGVDALDCPAGASVAKLGAGDRVLALKRSDDSAYLEVRNPYDVNQLVWLPAGVVVVDHGEASISSLAVGGCPKPALALDALPTQAPTEAPAPPAPGPAPAPKPTKPAVTPPPNSDTTKPAIVSAKAVPKIVLNDQASTLHVVATDNIGVTSITATWSGAASGSQSLVKVGGEWQMTWNSTSTAPGSYGDVKFVFTAHDAAGNLSATAGATVNRQYFG